MVKGDVIFCATGADADEYDIEYIKQLLQTKQIENIIVRAYYYELNKDDFKSNPENNEPEEDEEDTEENEKRKFIQ